MARYPVLGVEFRVFPDPAIRSRTRHHTWH
jgi:hypothetical protein